MIQLVAWMNKQIDVAYVKTPEGRREKQVQQGQQQHQQSVRENWQQEGYDSAAGPVGCAAAGICYFDEEQVDDEDARNGY